MKNLFRKILFMATLVMVMTSCFLASASEEQNIPFSQRIKKLQKSEVKQVEPLKMAFYMDSEGHANFEKKVLDEIVESIQAKVSQNATIIGDDQFLADFDLYRELKYDELMEEMEASNPQFAVLGGYAESGKKVKMTKKVMQNYLENSPYDGIVVVRMDVTQVKASPNFWIGVDTKAELDVTIRVFNKHSKQGYVFANRQRVVGKSYGTGDISVDRAARKAIPDVMKKIDKIVVE